MIEKITDHFIQAKRRLITQYKNKTNIENTINLFADQIQELENMFFDLLLERWLASAIGVQLDGIGEILDTARDGRNDDDYRAFLYTSIAIYNSEGTIEDIIQIFKTLSGAEKVELAEIGIAGFRLTGINANPIIEESLIVNTINQTKIAGVKVDSIVLTTDIPFGFEAAIEALGFGDGEFARLIYSPPEFTFEGSNLTFAGGFGIGGFL